MTPRQRLASLIMGRNVIDYVDELRANGRTWPEIAKAVSEATSGEVSVTRQAIQQWASNQEPELLNTA